MGLLRASQKLIVHRFSQKASGTSGFGRHRRIPKAF